MIDVQHPFQEHMQSILRNLSQQQIFSTYKRAKLLYAVGTDATLFPDISFLGSVFTLGLWSLCKNQAATERFIALIKANTHENRIRELYLFLTTGEGETNDFSLKKIFLCELFANPSFHQITINDLDIVALTIAELHQLYPKITATAIINKDGSMLVDYSKAVEMKVMQR